MFEGFKVGLALGGGAARGLAHIGVLKVLEECEIPIDLIVGTSVGALVGGVYATTRSAAATERRFRDFIFSKQFKRAKFDFLKESRQASPGLLYNFVSLIKKGIFYSSPWPRRHGLAPSTSSTITTGSLTTSGSRKRKYPSPRSPLDLTPAKRSVSGRVSPANSA